MLMIAVVMAAATPQQPWVGVSAGPMFLRESGRQGTGTGPLLRVEVGLPLTERVAGEFWLTSAIESAPPGAPGDRALFGAGAGGRFLVSHLDSDGKLGLWLHGGAGWGMPFSGDGNGPMGFGGALLSFQPFVKRFTIGVEGDAIAFKRTLGFAVLPSLRCAF